MKHKIGDAETVDWKRAYDYSPDGISAQVSNRLRATSVSGDDIDDPTRQTWHVDTRVRCSHEGDPLNRTDQIHRTSL